MTLLDKDAKLDGEGDIEDVGEGDTVSKLLCVNSVVGLELIEVEIVLETVLVGEPDDDCVGELEDDVEELGEKDIDTVPEGDIEPLLDSVEEEVVVIVDDGLEEKEPDTVELELIDVELVLETVLELD